MVEGPSAYRPSTPALAPIIVAINRAQVVRGAGHFGLGPRSHLVTLMDAAILIRDLEPFRQARPVWDRAAEMILVAAETRKRADVQEATRQMLGSRLSTRTRRDQQKGRDFSADCCTEDTS